MKIRLRGGGKYHRAVIALAKLIDRPQCAGRHICGKALGFVKKNDAVSNVMQFPTVRRTVGEEALKKFDGSGDNDRNAPAGSEISRFIGKAALTVVNQKAVCGFRKKNLAVSVFALLRQRQKGQY